MARYAFRAVSLFHSDYSPVLRAHGTGAAYNQIQDTVYVNKTNIIKKYNVKAK